MTGKTPGPTAPPTAPTPQQLAKLAMEIERKARDLARLVEAAAAMTRLPILAPYPAEIMSRYGEWLPKRLNAFAAPEAPPADAGAPAAPTTQES